MVRYVTFTGRMPCRIAIGRVLMNDLLGNALEHRVALLFSAVVPPVLVAALSNLSHSLSFGAQHVSAVMVVSWNGGFAFAKSSLLSQPGIALIRSCSMPVLAVAGLLALGGCASELAVKESLPDLRPIPATGGRLQMKVQPCIDRTG